MAISAVLPFLGPLLLALALGALIGNVPRGHGVVLTHVAAGTKSLLRWGVVLVGLRISGGDLLSVRTSGVVVILTTVTLTYTATIWVGRRVGVGRDLVILVAAGFSICGAAAIAAVNDVVKARQSDVALAVTLATVYGSAMIVALPALAAFLGLSDRQAAVWAGASIHEVAQVVAAASLLGAPAVAIATTIKLGRVMLLAPVCVAAARGASAPGAKAVLVPWFVGGFGVAVAIRSAGVLNAEALTVAAFMTTLLLSAGMFGMGLGIRGADLWPVPRPAVALASAATAVAAGTSLALVCLLVR